MDPQTYGQHVERPHLFTFAEPANTCSEITGRQLAWINSRARVAWVPQIDPGPLGREIAQALTS